VNCNIVQRGAINHMGGCMRAGGVCIGCTMPGFPDKFSPFYKTPPGAIVSTFAAKSVGAVVRRLRRLSNREANREHRWDVLQEVPSGWAHVQPQTVADRTIKFFYGVWQHLGAKKPGRPPGQEERFWGADRPGLRTDYLDDTATRENRDDRR
jgi:hydrogenase small subunit